MIKRIKIRKNKIIFYWSKNKNCNKLLVTLFFSHSLHFRSSSKWVIVVAVGVFDWVFWDRFQCASNPMELYSALGFECIVFGFQLQIYILKTKHALERVQTWFNHRTLYIFVGTFLFFPLRIVPIKRVMLQGQSFHLVGKILNSFINTNKCLNLKEMHL